MAAFLSKFGNNILKQTPSKQLNGQVYLSSPPWLFQAIRCMSSPKLCVKGIGYSMNVKNLEEAFSKYGEIIQVRISVDRVTGRSRGFGFVTFISEEASSRALKALNGKVLHGRVLKLDYATNRNSDGVAEAMSSLFRNMKLYKETPLNSEYAINRNSHCAAEALKEFLADRRKKHGKPLFSYHPLKKE